MATFEVIIETITVSPHPNADRLELARVGLYNVVVGKDTYKTGEQVLYIPEYSVLPENIIIALNLEGKLAGSKHNRVKPIKLRGEISQGLVAPLDLLPNGIIEDNRDYAAELEITKWEPTIPIHMNGEVEGNTDLINWIEIENIKKFPDTFAYGEIVHISEKIHGTCTLITVIFSEHNDDVDILVSSKGLGSKTLVIKEDLKNVYWRAVRQYEIENFAHTIANRLKESGTVVSKVAIFAETFGSGIQDLNYGAINNLGFAVFDVFAEDYNGTGFWLNPNDLEDITLEAEVPVVPTLYIGGYSLEKVIEHAYGKETISGKELHIREGVVIRKLERDSGYSAGSKQIAKYISDDYLLRKGNTTEYQ